MSSGPRPPRPYEVVESCPGCGAKSFDLAYPPNLCRCDDCGLYFDNPRPHPKRILEYYDSGVTYARFQSEGRVRDHLWAKRLRRVLRFRGSGRLLDVGTGDGHFLHHARTRFAAEGIEVSRAGVRLARERGLKVWHGSLDELSLEKGVYDVVTLWHVLEHLPSPTDALARVHELMAVDGYLFVAVPNGKRVLDLQRLLRRRHSPFPPFRGGGDEIHLTHFTPGTLRGLLERQGFRPVHLGPDDVDTERMPKSRALETLWRTLGRCFARRWCTAIYVACRRGRRSRRHS